jgi:TolB-like protein/tetratricopeptide (TPR) repeat protein
MLLFLVGGGIFWYFQRASETATVASPPPPSATAFATDASIAVLPFVNMSADKEQEYFADGISEELLNLLAQVPELRVIARTSSFSFKGKDVEIAEIARRLNVANVLEGSVRKSGDKLRITAQLVRASDSSHLWSQTFDRQMADVFAVQDEIAAEVVSQLRIKLLGAAPRLRATDPRAYALFLKARDVTRPFTPASIQEGIALYEQALAIDNTYAPAWDGIAEGTFGQLYLAVVSTDQGLPRARRAIDQALAHDPGYAPAYARLAMIEAYVENDLARGAQHLEQGLALDPANLDLLGAGALIGRQLGRLDKAIALGKLLVARDPLNVAGHDRLCTLYFYAGRLDEALDSCREVLALSPDFAGTLISQIMLLKGDPHAALAAAQQEPAEPWRLVGLSMAYHALGREADSDAVLTTLIREHASLMTIDIAYVLAVRGDADGAFEWLERVVSERQVGLMQIHLYPMFESLHSDPRWLPFLRKYGMAPEQLAAIKFDVTVPK